jgi:glycosyltransferase involved in cell wall biosynthesis
MICKPGEPMEKKKILMLSDHMLSTSGVGCQSRYLANGLVEKGCWSIRQLGAAIKHEDYRLGQPHPDILIKPVDGFGNRDMIRQLLAIEKPDLLLLFTDPRFFIWVWEMEDEIHQTCPIAYWHVWDNEPFPAYNNAFYASTDLINCHSHLTYRLVSEHHPNKTNFIPHALPQDIFKPINSGEAKTKRKQLLGDDRADHFVGLWINRNAKRKRPNDVLASWKIFLDELEAKYGHRKATLIMHTDPHDQEGPNLIEAMGMLGLNNNVFFSTARISFEDMNVLHNVSDFCVNIALNEGFGLPTLEAMQAGKPIIAQKTGGLTRQVVDHRDGSENGIALDPDVRTLVGSQMVPYIYEDYCSNEKTAAAYMKLYELGPEGRDKLGEKARQYALSEFNLQDTIEKWHQTMWNLSEEWKSNKEKIYPPYRMKKMNGA